MALPTLVQHASFDESGPTSLVTAFDARLMNTVGSGNFVLVTVITRIPGGNGGTPTVADDKSGTWTAGPTLTSLSNKKIHTFYRWNVTDSMRVVTVSYSTAGEQIDGVTISEFMNIKHDADPKNVSSTNTGSSSANPTLSSANITPAVNDLIYYIGVMDDTGIATTYTQEMTKWTNDSTNAMEMETADLRLLYAIQKKVSTSASAQNFTMKAAGITDGWGVLCISFTSEAYGTAPNTYDIHVKKAWHFNVQTSWANANFAIQLPADGNCIIGTGCSEANKNIATMTDTKGNVWTNRGRTPSDGNLVTTHHIDLINGNSTDTNVLTVTCDLTWGGGEPFVFYDVENVLQYDTRGTLIDNSGSAGAGVTSFTGASVTPTKKRSLLVAALAEDISTGGLSMSGHSPGNFQSSLTTPLQAASNADDNDGFAIAYVFDGSATTSTWTKTSTSTIGNFSTIIAAYTEIATPYLPLDNNMLRRRKRFVAECLD